MILLLITVFLIVSYTFLRLFLPLCFVKVFQYNQEIILFVKHVFLLNSGFNPFNLCPVEWTLLSFVILNVRFEGVREERFYYLLSVEV